MFDYDCSPKKNKTFFSAFFSDFQLFYSIFQSILISIFDLFFNTEMKKRRLLHYKINSPQEVVFRAQMYLLDKWLGDGAREELVECPCGVKVKRVFQLRNLRKENKYSTKMYSTMMCTTTSWTLPPRGHHSHPLTKRPKAKRSNCSLKVKI